MSDPEFDPDAFLAEPAAEPSVDEFDPDAFLADETPAPAKATEPGGEPTQMPDTSSHGFMPKEVPLTADFISPTGMLTWQVQGEQKEEKKDSLVYSPEYLAKKEAEDERLRFAFGQLQKIPDPTAGMGDDAAALAIADRWGLKVDMVRQHLPEFRRTAALANFDVDTWRKQTLPEVQAWAVDNPAIAPVILADVEHGFLSESLRALGDAVGNVIAHPIETARVAQDLALGPLLRATVPGYKGGLRLDSPIRDVREGVARELVRKDWETGTMAADPAERAAFLKDHGADLATARTILEEKDKREEAAKHTEELVDERAAKATGPFDPLHPIDSTKLGERTNEQRAGQQASALMHDLMLLELRGATPDETLALRSQIHDLKLDARPRALGEGQLGRVAADAAQAVTSMVEMLPTVLQDASAGSTALGIAGGIVGGVATRSPQGAMKGATAGMRLGAKTGATWGTFEYSFRTETGSTYEQLRDLKLEDGRSLTVQEAAGGAIIAGALKAGLEVLEMRAMLKTLGPMREALLADGASEIKRLMLANPRFRVAAAKAGKQWVESGAENGLEETMQEMVDEIVPAITEGVAGGDKGALRKEAEKVAAGETSLAQAAVDATKATIKLPEHPILNPEEMGRSGVVGALGGLAVGGVGSVLSLAGPALVRSREQRNGDVVKQILKASEHEAAKADPKGMATVMEGVTGKSGPPVTALHIDGPAVAKYFQEKGLEGEALDTEVTKLLGEDGPAKLAEAVASGGRVEVPLEQVNRAYGTSEAAKALAGDTSTHPELLTPNQLKGEQAAAIEHQAQRIADEALRSQADAETLNRHTEALEQQLRDSGASKDEARTVALVVRHLTGTAVQDFQKTAAELFPDQPIVVARGDEALAGTKQGRTIDAETSPVFAELARRLNEQDVTTPEGKAALERDFFHDSTSGLLNDRAWARIEPTAKTVGTISIEGVKYANDKQGGHKSGDAVYAAAAQALAAAPELQNGTLSKVKGDFAIANVTQEQLDAALAKANANPVLQGFQLSGAVAEPKHVTKDNPTMLRASAAMVNEAKSTAEKATPAQRAERGAQPLKAPSGPLKLDAKPVTDTPIAEHLKEALAKRLPSEAFNEMYVEKATGLWTKDGRDRYLEKHPQKFHVSLDLNLLKAFNTLLTDAGGDQVIERFGKVMAAAGAHEFVGTHVSGDEYTLDGNDQDALKRFIADLRYQVDARRFEVRVTQEDGNVLRETLPGLTFGAGIGENIDAAEAQLNIDKERLAAAGKRGRDFTESLRIAKQLLADERARRQTSEPERVPGKPAAGVEGDQHRNDRAADRELASVGSEAQGEGSPAPAAEHDGRGVAAGNERLPEREAADRRLKDALITERESKGPLRAEERDAIEQGFNRPRDLEQAAASVSRFKAEKVHRKASETALSVGKRLVEAKERLELRRKAARAFLLWVTNDGPGIAVEGMVGAREGALTIDQALWDQTQKWGHKHNLVDPQSGLTQLREDGHDGSPDAQMRRAKGKAALSSYDKAVKEDRANAFATNVLGKKNRLNQDGENVPKGYTEIPEANAAAKVVRVFLNRSADVSTAVHEISHAWLELYGRLAERPDAPARVKETYAATLKALGAESREGIKREHHEAFARSFEAYLLEGKAPKADLVRAFTRLKQWLLGIYRTVAGVPGQKLNDDLRRVFDAMLASENELEAARKKQGPSLFSTAKEAGVSEQAFAEQLQAQRDAVTEASRPLELAAIKDALRVHEAWWKAGLKKLRAAFGEEYEALPGRRAQALLEGNLPGLKTEPFVLNRAQVQEVLGKRRVAGLKTAASGENVSDVAQLAGFPDAASFLTALAELPSKETWVEQQAQAEMQAQHPGIFQRRQELQHLVASGLNPYTEKRILDEWRALKKRDPSLNTVPVEVLKRAAALMIERALVGKLVPGTVLRDERKAASEKATAAAKGQWTKAAAAARTELLNAFRYRETLKAIDERDRTVALAKQLAKDTARERLGKASPAYLNAVDFIVERLGFREVDASSKLDATAITQAVAQMNGDAVVIGDPEWLPGLLEALQADSYRKVDVGQLRMVRDALEQLRAAARQRSTVLIEGKRVDKEATVAELIADATKYKKQEGPLSSSVSAEPVLQWMAALPGRITAPLLKIEEMTDWLGGVLQGVDPRKSAWYRAVFKPIESARQRAADLHKSIAVPILHAFEKMPATASELFDGAKYFPGHQVNDGLQRMEAPTRRFELLMMALNAGNESSIDRLTKGRNLTVDQLQKALQQLTAEEIAWVNSVHDAFEKLWPETQALEERTTGLKPEGVGKQATALANGTLSGGYFPAIYDKRVSAAGENQAATQVSQMMDPSYSRPTTSHGYTKARVEGFVGPIQLEPSAVTTHLAQHVHDLAYREALMSVGGLILDPRVQATLKNSLGQARAAQFLSWAKDVGTATGVEGSQAAGDWLKLARKVRANTTMSALAYSVPNFFEDFSAILSAAFDRELKLSYLSRGMLEMFKGAKPWAAIEAVEAKSATMRAANDTIQRDLTRRIDDLTKTGPLNAAPLRWIRQHAFVLIEATYKATATPIWMGRYLQALGEGEAEAGAIDAADKTVRRLFPMHSAVNAAGVVRDRGFIGTSLQFYGFFSTVTNTVLTNLQTTLEGEKPLSKVQAMGRTLGYMTAIGLIGSLLRGKGPDDGEPYDEWAERTMLTTGLSMIPFAGDLGNTFDAMIRGKPMTQRSSSGLLGLVNSIGDAVVTAASDKDPDKKVEAALRALGPILNLPISQPMRTGKYIYDTVSGDREVRGPFDAASGLLYGESDRKAQTPLRAVQDVISGE